MSIKATRIVILTACRDNFQSTPPCHWLMQVIFIWRCCTLPSELKSTELDKSAYSCTCNVRPEYHSLAQKKGLKYLNTGMLGLARVYQCVHPIQHEVHNIPRPLECRPVGMQSFLRLEARNRRYLLIGLSCIPTTSWFSKGCLEILASLVGKHFIGWNATLNYVRRFMAYRT